jgi:hypothetical protein
VAIIYVSRWQRAAPIEQAAPDEGVWVEARGEPPMAEGAEAFAQKLVAALKEQADDNLRAGLALTRAWHVGQVLAIQSRFLRASLARMADLNARYATLIQRAMAKAVAEERSRLDRAA